MPVEIYGISGVPCGDEFIVVKDERVPGRSSIIARPSRRKKSGLGLLL